MLVASHDMSHMSLLLKQGGITFVQEAALGVQMLLSHLKLRRTSDMGIEHCCPRHFSLDSLLPDVYIMRRKTVVIVRNGEDS